ncbi:hypothetical protein [Ferrimonas balearica]|uniref:hypothetical protein n=1 Tax=Ferrimonas balearica TaxID=44012 RepID=UPI001C9984A8|nr:hypothetical protein [Ferrimonas balearica]MBY5991760.1 hypothetical protein [Ferrimonas balearica]
MKSLFCIQGRDSRLRSALVHLSLVAVLLLWVALFVAAQPATRLIVGLGLALPGAALSLAAARRRLNDSARPATLAWPALGLWGLFAVVQTLSPFSLWATLAGAAYLGFAALLSAFPVSRNRGRFAPGDEGVWGYSGPVDLSALHQDAPVARYQGRVEPSLDGRGNAPTVIPEPQAAQPDPSYWDDEPKGLDITGLLKRVAATVLPLLQKQWKPLAGIVGVVVLLSLAVSFWPKGGADTAASAEVVEVAKPEVPVFEHQVAMPDTYELLMNQDGIIVKWPGDPSAQGEIWSLLTAKGERQCAQMRFNNGNSYRAVKVEVWPGDVYYAYFSPLDTSDIVYDVAMRGNFTLCGYPFSLRGSMDILRAHPAFALYTRR